MQFSTHYIVIGHENAFFVLQHLPEALRRHELHHNIINC
jgi:hypothetical protein